jgi:phage recombination protein Bet
MTSTALETRQQPATLAIRPGQLAWDDTQLAALAQLGIRDASDGDRAVFLHQCQRTGLDPFARQIYMIGRREKQSEKRGNAWVDTWTTKWTIQTGIDGYRVNRDRAERRAGVRGILGRAVFYDHDGQEFKVWVRSDPPAACEITYTVRDANGETPYTSVLQYAEYVQLKDGRPIAQWASKPAHMLEKCTEADVYRKAFPQDFSGIYLDDAMPPAPEPEPGAVRDHGRVAAAEIISSRAEPPRAAPAPPVAEGTGHAGPGKDEPKLAPPEMIPAGPEHAAALDTPAGEPRATTGQAGIIVRHFQRLGFGEDEREQRLAVCGTITGRAVTSTKELTQPEAKTVMDTLARCKDRDALIALLVAGEKPRGDDDA